LAATANAIHWLKFQYHHQWKYIFGTHKNNSNLKRKEEKKSNMILNLAVMNDNNAGLSVTIIATALC